MWRTRFDLNVTRNPQRSHWPIKNGQWLAHDGEQTNQLTFQFLMNTGDVYIEYRFYFEVLAAFITEKCFDIVGEMSLDVMLERLWWDEAVIADFATLFISVNSLYVFDFCFHQFKCCVAEEALEVWCWSIISLVNWPFPFDCPFDVGPLLFSTCHLQDWFRNVWFITCIVARILLFINLFNRNFLLLLFFRKTIRRLDLFTFDCLQNCF